MRDPDRFEHHRPMLLAGPRRRYAFASAAAAIPADWATFIPRLPLPGQVGTVTYGAMCGVDLPNAAFEYMPSVEVETFDGLDPQWGRMRVPRAHYAVFIHDGPVSSIRETIGACHAWLAGNGDWKDAGTPDFERYGPDYDPATGGDVEFWTPVVRI